MNPLLNNFFVPMAPEGDSGSGSAGESSEDTFELLNTEEEPEVLE